MKTVAAAEAENRFGAILDEAQSEPVIIRRQEEDVAVLLSISEYERLRVGNLRNFLDLRNAVAGQAAANGLTEEHLADLLNSDEA